MLGAAYLNKCQLAALGGASHFIVTVHHFRNAPLTLFFRPLSSISYGIKSGVWLTAILGLL